MKLNVFFAIFLTAEIADYFTIAEDGQAIFFYIGGLTGG